MSGVTTRGKAAKAAQGAAVPSTSTSTPTNPVPMDPDAEAQAAEQARLEMLAKHGKIKKAWEKRNKMVFRGAGKMTTGAYNAAVSKVVWEAKYLVKGKNKQAVVLEKNFPLGQEEPTSAANCLNLKSGHNLLANALQRFVKKEFGVDLETGTSAISNSVWTNILKQLPRLPEGYQWHHLKRQVLANTVVNRDQLYDDLKEHVDNSELSYSEICEHFANAKSTSVIPHGAGDFIIYATQLFIKQPIVIVKPYIKPKKKKTDDDEYGIEKVYLNDEYKNLSQDEFNIVMVYNGLNYFAPAMEKIICDLSGNLTSVRTHTADALDSANLLLSKIPPSGCKDSLSKATLHMRAARELLRSAHVATGTTNIAANFAANVPVPLPSRSKVTRPRLFVRPANPAKKRKMDSHQTGENMDAAQEEQAEEEKDLAEQYTGRCEGQCVCGEQFDDSDALDIHYRAKHKEPKSWVCIGTKVDKKGNEIAGEVCGESFDRGDKLWTHYRKVHLGVYRYHCNLSPNCHRKIEERAGWLYHKEVKHHVGRSSIRCQYCDRPIAQINKVKSHEMVCASSGTNKKDKLIDCDHCAKSFRSRQYYLGHLATYHAQEAGVTPARHHCNVCGRDYANSSSLKNHECRPEGEKRRRKSKATPDSTTQ